MNRCIVLRLLDQFLVARIDQEPFDCMRLLEHVSSSTCLIFNMFFENGRVNLCQIFMHFRS